MVSFFKKREQRLALRIVGDGDTECALIKGMKQIIQDLGALPKNLAIKISSLKRGGGNPSNALNLSLQKHFSNTALQRRVLIVDSEGMPIDAGLLDRAKRAGIEMKISEPCIERHLMLAYGLPCSASLKPYQCKKAISTYFGTDFHPCDPDWHAKQIKSHGLEKMRKEDVLIDFIHDALTSISHPAYK